MKVEPAAKNVILAVSLSHVLAAALLVKNEERVDARGIDEVSDTFKTVVKVSEAAGSTSGAAPSSSKPIEQLRKSFEKALRISEPPKKKQKKAAPKKLRRLKSGSLSKFKGPLKLVGSKESKLQGKSRARAKPKQEGPKPRKQFVFASVTWAQDGERTPSRVSLSPRLEHQEVARSTSVVRRAMLYHRSLFERS